MDINKRFDQLESLLVDLARKQDQQSEQIAQILRILSGHGEAINSLGHLLNSHTDLLNSHTDLLNSHTDLLNSHTDLLNSHTASFQRQEHRLNDIGEQIGDIINILKISETRHTETARQQDDMLLEIQRLGNRTDASVEAIKLLFNRQESTNTRLDGVVQTQLQMLQLQRLDADKIDELNRQLPATESQEPRIKRLEDEVFRAAS